MALFFHGKKNKDSSGSRQARKRLDKSLGKNRQEIEEKPRPKSDGWFDRIDWPKTRINCVIGFFCIVWLCLWGRAWHLQMIEGPRLADKARRQHMASELVSGRRGMIYDRNGLALARSVEARSIYANPLEIEDLNKTVAALAPLLRLPQDKIRAELGNGRKRFVWLKRKVDDATADAVAKANLPGIGFTREYDRFYPFKHMAGQLLGFVGIDDHGLEGIERSMEGKLGAMPVRQIVQRDAMGRRFYLNEEGSGLPVGEDVHLTLDMHIQFIAEEAIAAIAREFDARWSGALVVDVKSGDILAWAQYPFFNPNNYREASPPVYRNRLAADAHEPGSTFKPFIMAAALQEKKITADSLIDCESGRWTSKNYTIRDTSVRSVIPASKVMRYSSNIGMAKIGLALGPRRMHKYLTSLGFGETSHVQISNSKGIVRVPRDWSDADTMAASFGQSISVTGLQMAQAYLTLLNNGLYKPLRLVIEPDNVQEAPRRIFNEQTVRDVLGMMKDVVEAPDGTGKRARIEGIAVGGKTGTAQKADNKTGKYGDKTFASFAGFFPADDPRYFILVLADEPARNQFGGIVAAPAFKEIAAKVLTHTGILNESFLAKNNVKKPSRGRKLSTAPGEPWLCEVSPVEPVAKQNPGLTLPGHLARRSQKVPDVTGKSVRNAVEQFARAGIVPELKGSGSRVVRQTPNAGIPWPDADKKVNYILWLSER